MDQMMTVTAIFLIAAAICVVAEAMGRCPPWVSKVLMLVVLALLVLPK